MDQTVIDSPLLVETSKRLGQRLLASGANRVELLVVELQEERQHLLHLLLLGVGAAMLGLLAMIALSVFIVILLWAVSEVLVLLALTIVYGGAALFLYRKVVALQRNWKSLPATADQLNKDRLWLENILQ